MINLDFLSGSVVATILNIIYIGVIITAILVVILDNRNPVKTMAWILVLMFLPVAGLVLYYFFGRSYRRRRIINKKWHGRLLEKSLTEYVTQESQVLPESYERFVSLLRSTCHALPFNGNNIELYTTGKSMLHALLRVLYSAERHIHMEFYIFEDDAVGRLVRDVLVEKAKEGVEVRVLYDDVGCWRVPNSFFEEMREAGIEVRSFLKVRFPLFTNKVNYRNHRKIVVVDGCVGFIGGMNIASRYVNGVSWGVWRDTLLRVEGKAVYGLQMVFLYDWFFVDRTLMTSSSYFPKLRPCGSSLVQIAAGAPVDSWRGIMQGIVKAISGAKHYFYIQTPYFLPTEAVLNAMQMAALAGVDVRLMLPLRADNRLTHLGSCSFLADVLQAGVKVYFYSKGFLHSKLMVSDDMLFTIGSTNMDFRSFEHNFEVNAFVYDGKEALKARDIFLQDQRDCQQVFLKAWRKRPWYRKLLESMSRLWAPLL